MVQRGIITICGSILFTKLPNRMNVFANIIFFRRILDRKIRNDIKILYIQAYVHLLIETGRWHLKEIFKGLIIFE